MSDQVQGVFRPHPQGFGFVGDLFVRPKDARLFLDGDIVEASVQEGPRGPVADRLSLQQRPRTALVILGGNRPQILPQLGSGRFALSGQASRAAAGADTVAAVLLDGGKAQGSRVLAGPVPAGTPDGARLVAAVRALDGGVRPPEVDGEVLDAVLAAAANGHGDVPVATDGFVADADDRHDRLDMQEVCAVTVDNASTKDRDDALSAASMEDGRVRVWVHISDVAAAVPDWSALQRRASTMATSAYLGGVVVPMFPSHLSEGELSLIEGLPRRALSVSFTVDRSGACTDVEVRRTRVKVDANLTYHEVAAHLQSGRLHGSVASTVDAAARAADMLGAERSARATVEGLFRDATETVVVDGGRATIRANEDVGQAQTVVERIMVAANETVAAWLHDRGAPTIYRAHRGVKEEAKDRLHAAARRDDLQLDGFSAEEIAAAGHAGATVAAVATASLQHAVYAPEPEHHYGLDASPYTHFTSPIRRAADLLVHRCIAAELDGSARLTVDDTARSAVWLSERSGATARCEGLLRSALWGQALDGETLRAQGHVSRLSTRGIAVRVPRIGMFGFVPARSLGRPRLLLSDDKLASADGNVKVGDTLDLALAGVEDGRLLFAVVPPEGVTVDGGWQVPSAVAPASPVV